MIPSAHRMTNGSMKDHSALVCPTTLCSQNLQPRGNSKGDEETWKIENMLCLIQEEIMLLVQGWHRKCRRTMW